MPEWNSKNRISIENVEQKFFKTLETEDGAIKMYNEDAEDFIESIDNNPKEFGELDEKEIIKLKNEVRNASQEYEKKERGIIARRLGQSKNLLKTSLEKTNKTFRAIVMALVMESALFGCGIPISQLKPEISLVENVQKLTRTAEYEKEYTEEEIISFLKEKVPQIEIDKICNLKNNEDKKRGVERKIPLIGNIEDLGIKKEDIELILKTFPDSFIANINRIRYKAENEAMPERYGIIDGQGAQANRISKIITFFEIAKSKSYDELSYTIAHEIAHLNDWGTNKYLSIKDRLSLCKTIIERVESKDRCDFSYIESISNKDKKLELLLKALEYFAGICDLYFNSPDLLPNKDKKIIQEMIKKTDPSFNQEKQYVERRAILKKINSNTFWKWYE